ncbi:MAG: hypothetical protein ACF8MJ_12215 [Phycisphaerales bacterium JB050]
MKPLAPSLGLPLALSLAAFGAGCASTSTPAAPPAPTDPLHAWLGTWSGTATNHRPDGTTFDFPMTLEIEPVGDQTDHYTWTITYGEGDRQQIRPYELIVIDAPSGRYAIDEQNSIVLDTTMLDGALYSQFEIEGVRLTTCYRLSPEADQMTCEILTTPAEPASITGDTGGVPPVNLFPPSSLQRATLRRSP